jgi:hypothetical protein
MPRISGHILVRAWWVAALGLAPLAVAADVPSAQRGEVEYLLTVVKHTGCIVERNGARHPGAEAYDHVMQKYEYFRDRIRTTEDFIEYAAAKSTMSGKDYLLRCPGAQARPTREWLLDELAAYRQGRAESAAR